jgi:hypothetical protein
VRLPDGTVVRLEAIRVAGRFLTSVEAVHRFIARQQADASPVVEAAAAEIPTTTSNSRTPAKRARDSENALRRLETSRLKSKGSAGS